MWTQGSHIAISLTKTGKRNSNMAISSPRLWLWKTKDAVVSARPLLLPQQHLALKYKNKSQRDFKEETRRKSEIVLLSLCLTYSIVWIINSKLRIKMFSKNKQRCSKFGLVPKKGTKILNVHQVSAGFSTQIITCTFPLTADEHKSRPAACYGQYIQGNSSREIIFVCHNRRTSYLKSFKLV